MRATHMSKGEMKATGVTAGTKPMSWGSQFSYVTSILSVGFFIF